MSFEGGQTFTHGRDTMPMCAVLGHSPMEDDTMPCALFWGTKCLSHSVRLVPYHCASNDKLLYSEAWRRVQNCGNRRELFFSLRVFHRRHEMLWSPWVSRCLISQLRSSPRPRVAWIMSCPAVSLLHFLRCHMVTTTSHF